MQATVFWTDGQEALARTLDRLLRVIVYPGIQVDRVYIDPERLDKGVRQYFRLLMNAALTIGEFALEVEDSQGNWSYVGYDPHLYGNCEFLRLEFKDASKLFPSISLMDQMVLVPESASEVLDGPSGFPYLFMPLETQGVLLADFTDSEAVHGAISAISDQFGRNFTRLAQRQTMVRRIPQPDYNELSNLLKITDIDYLREIYRESETPLHTIQIDVLSEPLPVGRSTDLELRLKCSSERSLGDVRVDIRGPYGAIREAPIHYVNFDNKTSSEVITVRLSAPVTPFCPIEVRCRSAVDPSSVATFSFPLTIAVRES